MDDEVEQVNERRVIPNREQLIKTGILNLSVGLLFLLMSLNKSFYENDECIYLKEKGSDFGAAIVILSLFQISFYFFIDRMEEKLAESVYQVITGLLFIVGIVFCILLWYGVSKGEPCGALRILSIVYIVVIFLSLFCFVLILCFLIIFSANRN